MLVKSETLVFSTSEGQIYGYSNERRPEAERDQNGWDIRTKSKIPHFVRDLRCDPQTMRASLVEPQLAFDYGCAVAQDDA